MRMMAHTKVVPTRAHSPLSINAKLSLFSFKLFVPAAVFHLVSRQTQHRPSPNR
jgi:hypothetical protein